MIETTINIEIPPQPEMHCIAALANVLRHLAYLLDQPEARNVTVQHLLHLVATIMMRDEPKLHPEVRRMLEHLASPVAGSAPPSKKRNRDHLRGV